jgi:hypothetical protein
MQSSLSLVVVLLVGLSLSTTPILAGGSDAGAEKRTPPQLGDDWQSVTDGTDAEPPTVADQGGGRYRIHVATGDPRMIVDLDLSLLRSPLDPGGLTMSSVGTIGDERVVSVAIGVRFDGVDDAGTFFEDPFEGFAIVSRSTLSLPFPTTTEAIVEGGESTDETPAGGSGGQDDGDVETGDDGGGRA